MLFQFSQLKEEKYYWALVVVVDQMEGEFILYVAFFVFSSFLCVSSDVRRFTVCDVNMAASFFS